MANVFELEVLPLPNLKCRLSDFVIGILFFRTKSDDITFVEQPESTRKVALTLLIVPLKMNRESVLVIAGVILGSGSPVTRYAKVCFHRGIPTPISSLPC